MATTTTIQKKKAKNQSREAQFSYKLNSCSKSKDLRSALSLYDSALSDNTRLNQHQLNTLLFLCSTSISDESTKDLAIQYGYGIFEMMEACGIKFNEASITSFVRLAAAKGDGDYAFKLVKEMGAYNLVQRLRTYSPVLLCFCEKLEADKAYEVEQHMGTMGICLEEMELMGLLKVSAETCNHVRVYKYLLKLRETVRCVREETSRVIEDWFTRFEVNGVALDDGVVREAVVRNGGGWHGLGWLGEGKWVLKRGSLGESEQCCCCCGIQLVGVDIDDAETEKFAGSVATLAMEREAEANFGQFQTWLDKHADYEAIVDAANIGLYQQNFGEGGFSVPQLDAVVKELYDQRKKWPLIIFHNKRVRALLEDPTYPEIVDEWKNKDVLYTTPPGSNDDWYWLYAAVKLRCLLVTNDEMRDHIFELLGRSFFLKWKERHQVRYTFLKGTLKLQMPPPFSIVIQESENRSWHVPVACNDNSESVHTWLCVTRQRADAAVDIVNPRTSNHSPSSGLGNTMLYPSEPEAVHSSSNMHSNDYRSQNSGDPLDRHGKRKERSSPPS